mgnify:CR=1 FL=1
MINVERKKVCADFVLANTDGTMTPKYFPLNERSE